jgi:hypothetical protein
MHTPPVAQENRPQASITARDMAERKQKKKRVSDRYTVGPTTTNHRHISTAETHPCTETSEKFPLKFFFFGE